MEALINLFFFIIVALPLLILLLAGVVCLLRSVGYIIESAFGNDKRDE